MPIFVLTAMSMTDDRDRVLQLANDYIPKPYVSSHPAAVARVKKGTRKCTCGTHCALACARPLPHGLVALCRLFWGAWAGRGRVPRTHLDLLAVPMYRSAIGSTLFLCLLWRHPQRSRPHQPIPMQVRFGRAGTKAC